ncbi:hypothetical protein Rhe02_45300 [Rhizocola hellebori]|uniref:YdhG-like domain-containing protein n=1 Tax=Rhizocola hellebori TaxID=1392758 RepID=A0A8J3VI04_9ACTN|nr:DUF1801 domain-containing protein [Rhizocola hellebori]GIH06463.1 hypothetical protein Rhe02_45300 [Rhizocola hellebori]
MEVDDYISSYPGEIQEILQEVRRRIHEAVPGAGEKTSYRIPTFTLDGKYFVYMAAWKKHLSVYPVPAGMEQELAPYLAAKGTLRFMFDKPIPYELIAEVAKRLAGNRR